MVDLSNKKVLVVGMLQILLEQLLFLMYCLPQLTQRVLTP